MISTRVDRQPVLPGHLQHPLPGAGPVEEAGGGALRAEHDVLGHREHRYQHEVLVHHADARGDGVAGTLEAPRRAVHDDLTGVGL
jgi:hypothetical protein